MPPWQGIFSQLPVSGIAFSSLGIAYACRLRARRRQKLGQTDAAKQFGAHPIFHGVDHLSSVLGWIDMHPEGPFTEWRADNVDDRVCYRARIRIGRHDG